MCSDRFIDLIRHGEPVGGGYFRGSLDDPLSDLGWQQLQSSTNNFNAWDAIVSSPLQRCHAFAQHLSQQHNVPLMVDDNCKERHFGDWEGVMAKHINAQQLTQFWQQPSRFTPPNAESLDDFIQRAIMAWDHCLKLPYQHILILTHGGVIRALMGYILNMPSDAIVLIEVPYAQFTRIRIPNDALAKPSLMFHQSSL